MAAVYIWESKRESETPLLVCRLASIVILRS